MRAGPLPAFLILLTSQVAAATHLVVMRDGTRTVLAFQPESGAVILPVPASVKDTDVRALPATFFEHIEAIGAPRLVETWEQDPCPVAAAPTAPASVQAFATLTTGDYELASVAAKDAPGLDAWLHQQSITVSPEAHALLQPYIEAGSKFVVATGDGIRVQFDADTFAVPIPLDLAHTTEPQDLLVDIVARGQRYQVANAPNVTIPTDLDVRPSVKGAFSAFYMELFSATLAQYPRAVVTEYAWDATTCEPCTVAPLAATELAMLGADANPTGLIHTRLHARVSADVNGELVLAPAQPPASFQARYVMRHPWNGPIRCTDPRRGVWGGAPAEVAARPDFHPIGAQPALDLARAPRDRVSLASALVRDVPEIGLRRGFAEAAPPSSLAPPAEKKPAGKPRPGCGCATTDPGSAASIMLVVLGLRRRRRPS